MKIRFGTAVLLLSCGIALAQTEVPHTFESGTPARAAEVNENFAALEQGIRQLEAVVVDGVLDFSNPAIDISTPGYYVLDRNWNVDGLSLLISADDVTVDLRGYSLAKGEQTILVTGNNVVVRNGHVSGIGAVATEGFGTVFENLTIDAEIDGVVLGGEEEADGDTWPVGGGATLRFSSVRSDSVGVRVMSPRATVQGNFIQGFAGALQVTELFYPDERRWLGRVIDNRFSCVGRQEESCIYSNQRGTLFSRNTIAGLTQAATGTVVVLGDQSQFLDNTFTAEVANFEVPYQGTAIEVNGTKSVIRGTAMHSIIFNTGIQFLQSGNAYGDNQVTAFNAFDLGATTQRDLGGNWSD